MSNEANKIIYSMLGVTKTHDKKVILKEIYLSYFYGAKIGVLGLNGSGKSSLLRILAGVDTNYEGKISKAPSFTIGYLEQEPHLDASLTVRAAVEQGLGPIVRLLKEFEEVNERLADPKLTPEQLEKLLEKQGLIQEKLDASNAWDIDQQLEMAMDALRCPPAETSVTVLSGGEKR